mgnify:CR=1 FL=1
MKALFRVVMATLFSVSMIVGVAHAQTINVDLGKIDSTVAKQVLDQLKKVEPPAPVVTVDDAKKWASIGEDMGKAIAATAKALGTEVNEFIKTPVGWWVWFFIFWYLFGKKLFAIVGGIVAWIALFSVIWHSFSIFHIPKQTLTDEDKEGQKTYEMKSYEFKSDDRRLGSVWAHGLSAAVVSVVMMLIIFL